MNLAKVQNIRLLCKNQLWAINATTYILSWQKGENTCKAYCVPQSWTAMFLEKHRPLIARRTGKHGYMRSRQLLLGDRVQNSFPMFMFYYHEHKMCKFLDESAYLCEFYKQLFDVTIFSLSVTYSIIEILQIR